MIYRGTVLELTATGWVWVKIPSLTGDSPVGPVAATPRALTAGEDVLIAALRGRTDDLLVVSRAADAPPSWSEVTGKPSTFAPAPHSHTAADISSGVLDPARLPAATTSAAGSMSAADKTRLDAATSLNTPATLVFRNSGGDIAVRRATAVDQPSAVDQLTRRDYVDAQVATRAAATHAHTYADITGLVPTSALPPLAIQDTFTAGSQAEMLALVAQRGDVAIRTDVAKTFILSADTPGTLSAWKEFLATGQVVSVAGKTGVVLLVKGDVGLGNVDNTADLAKPVSTATQTALNAKADTANLRAQSIAAKPVADAPSTYPAGYSYFAAPTDGTWPGPYGTVSTVRAGVPRTIQHFVEKPSGRTWVRVETDADAWTAFIEYASTAAATAAAAGLMSAADKAKLDAATAGPTASTLGMRDSFGNFTAAQLVANAAAPTQPSHATRKDYVDAADALKLNIADALATKIATPKPATDLPNTYPLGFSSFGIGSDATWPMSLCTVFTVRDSAGRTFQMLVSKTTGRIMTRTETDGPAWTAWREAVDSGALSSTTSNNSVAQRTAAGNLYANRFYADGAQAPEANSLTRRDYVDAQIATCQPAETDTGWVTTGLTITAGTDWTVTSYRVRTIGALAYVRVTLTYGGTGITTNSGTGDITGDPVLCTLPSGWRPTEALPINIAQNGSREWFGQINTAGSVLMTHGLPAQTLANGSTITVRGMFFIV